MPHDVTNSIVRKGKRPVARLEAISYRSGFRTLRQQLLHHLAADVRQPEIAAQIAISQPRVVQAKAVKNSGLQVVNVDGVFDHVQSQLIRLADDLAPFDATAREPQ